MSELEGLPGAGEMKPSDWSLLSRKGNEPDMVVSPEVLDLEAEVGRSSRGRRENCDGGVMCERENEKTRNAC